MKKLIFVIGFLFLFGDAYSQWFYQNNPDSITTISSGSFINSNTGWYARSKGEISKTTDGGITWNTYKVTNVDLNSIKFTNENTGYVCGNSGRLMKSTNGGLNWSWQNPNSNDTLVTIDFVNENTGWCAGRDFIIFTTTGGAQWYRQYVDTNTIKPRFTVLKMYDSQNGLAGAYGKNFNGMYAYIYRTSNGGVNWNFIDSIDGYRVYSISYVNQNIVYLSNRSYLYKSTNAGLNWVIISSLSSHYSKSKIYFVNENIGWFAQYCLVLKTTNGGVNWSSGINFGQITISDLNYSINGLYVATNKGLVFKTTNEGTNWKTYSINIGADLFDISIIDANNIFISGNLGDIWKSTNGGENWQIKFRDSISDVNGPYFVNLNTGFICSANRFLFKSTNAGENWLRIGNMLPHDVHGMYCKDENNIWVVGDSGMIMKTTNSGIYWENKSLNPPYFIYGLKENNNTLFIQSFGQAGGLYKSTNQGNNWINIPLDSLEIPFNLNFLNYQTGWVTPTRENIFFKTYDGGNTWVKYNRSTEYFILNSCFVNENTGYAVTTVFNKGLIKTTNSGFNWFICSTFVNNNQVTQNVVFFNENTGWVVGYQGLICKTTNAGSTFITLNNQNIANGYSLSQNYPNPFNPNTSIKFKVEGRKFTRLVVYDILGKEVDVLVNEKLCAGEYEATFDGTNRSSGIYFYSLYADGKLIDTKKMVFLK